MLQVFRQGEKKESGGIDLTASGAGYRTIHRGWGMAYSA
jgi:hypothetical protein